MNVPKGIGGFICGFITGVALLAAVGFSVFNWTTASSAQQMADDAARDAARSIRAAICAAQAQEDPNLDSKLDELKTVTDPRRQGKLIEKEFGWATMPGEDAPKNGVGRICAGKVLERAEHTTAAAGLTIPLFNPHENPPRVGGFLLFSGSSKVYCLYEASAVPALSNSHYLLGRGRLIRPPCRRNRLRRL